jgi:hypothetical protein
MPDDIHEWFKTMYEEAKPLLACCVERVRKRGMPLARCVFVIADLTDPHTLLLVRDASGKKRSARKVESEPSRPPISRVPCGSAARANGHRSWSSLSRMGRCGSPRRRRRARARAPHAPMLAPEAPQRLGHRRPPHAHLRRLADGPPRASPPEYASLRRLRRFRIPPSPLRSRFGSRVARAARRLGLHGPASGGSDSGAIVAS